MLLHAFPSMSINSLREIPENCVYKHGELSCFIEYLYRKLLAANFLSYDIESARKKMHLLDLPINTMHSLFYSHVFNSSQKLVNLLVQLVIFSVEVYDTQIITCHFSFNTLYQPSFIYHPLSLSALGLIKGMI